MNGTHRIREDKGTPLADIDWVNPQDWAEEDRRVREAEIQLTRAQTGLEAIEEAPTQGQLERETRARQRGQKVFAAVIVLAILLGYLFTYFVSRNVGATAAKQQLLESTISSLEQTNRQRADVGLPPVDIPAVVSQVEDSGTGLDPSAITDAVTLNVVSLLETDPRFRGAPGVVGPVGPRGEPCLPENPECKGPPGQPGQPGQPGENGQNGQDGEPCDPSNPACRGPEGPPGQDAPTIDSANFQLVNGDCKVVLGLSDGQSIVGEAGEAACADAPTDPAPTDPPFEDEGP